MRKTFLYILASTFLFSSMEIALKMAGSNFAALQLNLIRFTIGGVLLLPIALHQLHAQHLTLVGSAPTFALTGFICVIVSMTFFQLAVENAPAATVAVLFSCNPVFALLFSYLILHETLARASAVSVVLSVIGLLIIVNPFHLTNPFGLGLAVVSAVTFGLYSIVSRAGSQKLHYNGVIMTAFTFLYGAAELFILVLISKLPPVIHLLQGHPGLHDFVRIPVLQGITWQTLPMLVYLGVGVTGFGFAFYFMAMERSDVSTASLVFFIKPGLAPIMAAVILGESIAANTIGGIIIILLGSVVAFMGESLMDQVARMLPTHHHNLHHGI